jgi:uncharacterized caspase-like protein
VRSLQLSAFRGHHLTPSSLSLLPTYAAIQAPPLVAASSRVGKYAATAAQIVAAARKLERAKVHFFATSGHGSAPYVSPETAAAILQAAPTMCEGFVEAETEPTKGMEALCYYLQHHVVPIMEACRRHGRGIMILREKDAWWAAQAATPELRRILFSGAYRHVI